MAATAAGDRLVLRFRGEARRQSLVLEDGAPGLRQRGRWIVIHAERRFRIPLRADGICLASSATRSEGALLRPTRRATWCWRRQIGTSRTPTPSTASRASSCRSTLGRADGRAFEWHKRYATRDPPGSSDGETTTGGGAAEKRRVSKAEEVDVSTAAFADDAPGQLRQTWDRATRRRMRSQVLRRAPPQQRPEALTRRRTIRPS